MASCYGKTQQGMVEKEKFAIPMFPSSSQFVNALGERLDESQKLTHELLLCIDERLNASNKGKKTVDYTYLLKHLEMVRRPCLLLEYYMVYRRITSLG